MAGLPVTVNGPGNPCAANAWNFSANPTGEGIPLTQKIKYYLCAAEHKAGQLALDAWHWIWGEISAAWSGLKNFAAGVADAVEKGLGWVWDKAKGIVQWLDDQAAHVLNWFMWAALGIGAFVLLNDFSPSINHAITSRRRRRKKA